MTPTTGLSVEAFKAASSGAASEEQFNQQFGVVLARTRGQTISGLTDDALQYAAARLRRALHDSPTSNPDRRRLQRDLGAVEREQQFRQCLTDTWLAREDGTHCYTAFAERGGLAAVLAGDAPPPSYALAVILDWERCQQGQPHVLNWVNAPDPAASLAANPTRPGVHHNSE